MEHVAGGKDGLTFVVKLPRCSFQITVSPDNLLVLRIPYDELLITVVTGVEFIDVDWLSCSSSGFAESNLAQTANLLHDIGRIVGCDDINLIVALVRHAQLLVRCQFALQQFYGNRIDDRLFHGFIAYRLVPIRRESSTCRRSARVWVSRKPRGRSCVCSCTSHRPEIAWLS